MEVNCQNHIFAVPCSGAQIPLPTAKAGQLEPGCKELQSILPFFTFAYSVFQPQREGITGTLTNQYAKSEKDLLEAEAAGGRETSYGS